jgi:hypothetical protein
MAGIAAVFTAFPSSVTLLSSMAAKEKTSRLMAWLAPILLLLAAVAAAPPASALTVRATETRAWEKTPAPLESRPVESLQLLNLHQQNGGAGYDDALGSPLAANNQPPLSRLHPDSTLTGPGNASSYNYWSKQPTPDIIDSLKPGSEEPLTVDSNGKVWQGNTRIKILQDRGVDVNSLPRVPK